MSRGVLHAVAAAAIVGSFNMGATASQDHTPARTQRVSLVGCLAEAPGGAFQLTDATVSSMSPRRTGSNSAKASTPVGSGEAAGDRPRTAGTTTAKGSTPIIVTVGFTRSTTSGANSAKASTPVRRNASRTYALDADGADMVSHAGHMVEVTGAVQRRGALKVQALHPLGANCEP
jgi:hypothetical protein